MATIETVNIEDVYPFEMNGAAMNPRDTSTKECQAYIAELAEQFRNNPFDPGHPYSQPILWRDGGIYQIIDGECRWRAMKQIGTKRFEAIVYDNLEDAEQARKMAAMGMVGTDTKLHLSDIEKSRGVQTALDLDIPDEAIAPLAKTDASGMQKMRRARKIVDDAAEDMSLLRLIAIGEYADDPEAVEALTNCKESEYYNIVRDLERKRLRKESLEAIKVALEEAGVKIVEEKPEGYAYECMLRFRDDLEKERDLTGCVAMLVANEYYNIYSPTDEEVDAAKEAEKQAQDARKQKMGVAMNARKKFFMEKWPNLPYYTRYAIETYGDKPAYLDWQLKQSIEEFELDYELDPKLVCVHVFRSEYRNLLDWHGDIEVEDAVDFLNTTEALKEDGYNPPQEELDLYDEALEYGGDKDA